MCILFSHSGSVFSTMHKLLEDVGIKVALPVLLETDLVQLKERNKKHGKHKLVVCDATNAYYKVRHAIIGISKIPYLYLFGIRRRERSRIMRNIKSILNVLVFLVLRGEQHLWRKVFHRMYIRILRGGYRSLTIIGIRLCILSKLQFVHGRTRLVAKKIR